MTQQQSALHCVHRDHPQQQFQDLSASLHRGQGLCTSLFCTKICQANSTTMEYISSLLLPAVAVVACVVLSRAVKFAAGCWRAHRHFMQSPIPGPTPYSTVIGMVYSACACLGDKDYQHTAAASSLTRAQQFSDSWKLEAAAACFCTHASSCQLPVVSDGGGTTARQSL